MKLVGISGSLRKDSYNTALLRAAADLMPAGTSLAVETIHGIPLYDADAEAADGIPARVQELKESIIGAQGVILATPEYNNSMPGVLKNALDWLSRPPADSPKVFANRPFAVIGASPGGFGTVLAQSAWLPVLRTLGVRPWFGAKMMLSHAGKAFDESGRLADEDVRKRLQKYLAGFVEFTGAA